MAGPARPGRWGGKGIPDLQPGQDRYPASQQKAIRQAVDRDFGGMGTRADASGAVVTARKGAAEGTFVVKVEKDGGVAGNPASGTIAAANCSFTYTVKDLYGVTLGTEVSPEKSRYPATIYLEAGSGDRSVYGIGGWDENGDLLLLDLDEIADAGEC